MERYLLGGIVNGSIMVQQSISTGTFCPTRWIVASDLSQGTHTTFTDAMATASAGDTIYIRSKSSAFTESFTWKPGVDLVAETANAMSGNAALSGVITISSVGTYSASGIQFAPAGVDGLHITAAANLYLTNCYFNLGNTTGITSNASAQIYLMSCQGESTNSGAQLFSISAGQIFIQNSRVFFSGGSTASALTTGGTSKFFIYNSFVGCAFTVAAGGGYNVVNSTTLGISITGTGTNNNIYNSTTGDLSIGTNCNVNLNNSIVTSISEPPISGSGSFTAAGLTFTGAHGVSAATTQIPNYSYGNILFTNIGTRTDPGVNLYVGTGAPTGLTELQGSLYLRTDGSASNNRAYINTNASTTWTAITTVA